MGAAVVAPDPRAMCTLLSSRPPVRSLTKSTILAEAPVSRLIGRQHWRHRFMRTTMLATCATQTDGWWSLSATMADDARIPTDAEQAKLLVLDDIAPHHHEANIVQSAHVLRRIAAHRDNVR